MNPRKKSDELDFFSVHLILTGFGEGENSSNRKIKVRFQISLLDSDGRPGKQAGNYIVTPRLNTLFFTVSTLSALSFSFCLA